MVVISIERQGGLAGKPAVLDVMGSEQLVALNHVGSRCVAREDGARVVVADLLPRCNRAIPAAACEIEERADAGMDSGDSTPEWKADRVRMEELRQRVLNGDLSSATLRALADAQDALAVEEANRKLLVVGRTVRVARGEVTERAIVTSVNSNSYDVMFEDDVEITVTTASALFPWENEDGSPSELKERGSELFKVRDFKAAAEFYEKALLKLKKPLQVGALVMLRSLKVGTLTAVGKTVDVMLEERDEDDLDRRQILVVLGHQEERKLMVTTFLNAARCASHLGRYQDAVTACTIAYGIAAYDGSEYTVTAKVLRGRAHLAMAHLKHALRDANAATLLQPQDKNVIAFNRDVERAKRAALKANKRLAKDVTEWVAAAQDKFTDQGGSEADCATQ